MSEFFRRNFFVRIFFVRRRSVVRPSVVRPSVRPYGRPRYTPAVGTPLQDSDSAGASNVLHSLLQSMPCVKASANLHHCAGEVYPGKYTWTDGRRTNGRRTDDGRKKFRQKNSNKKIPTTKIQRTNSDKKSPTKKFSDEKIRTKKNWGQGTGARHGRCGGKARVINGDSWGAKPPRSPPGARHG